MKNEGKWRGRARLVALVDMGRGALAVVYLIAGLFIRVPEISDDGPAEEWFVAEQLLQERENQAAMWTNLADFLGPVSYTVLQIWFSNRLRQATSLTGVNGTALRYSRRYRNFSLVVLVLIVCCPVLVVAARDNLASPPLVWVLLAFWLVSMLERLLYVFVAHQFILELRQQYQLVIRRKHASQEMDHVGAIKV